MLARGAAKRPPKPARRCRPASPSRADSGRCPDNVFVVENAVRRGGTNSVSAKPSRQVTPIRSPSPLVKSTRAAATVAIRDPRRAAREISATKLQTFNSSRAGAGGEAGGASRRKSGAAIHVTPTVSHAPRAATGRSPTSVMTRAERGRGQSRAHPRRSEERRPPLPAANRQGARRGY